MFRSHGSHPKKMHKLHLPGEKGAPHDRNQAPSSSVVELAGPTAPRQESSAPAAVVKLDDAQEPLSPWRVLVRDHVVVKDWFKRFILLVILLNCVTLTLNNPRLDDDDPLKETLEVIENVFTVIFTVEMLLKFAGLGVFRENGYFADNWNRLDFIIVVFGYLTLLPGVSNVSAIRILRVLRPLRTVNNLRGLRVMVSTLMKSMSGLMDVAVILAFFFVIYGIVGIQLWSGQLRQRCFVVGDRTTPLTFCSTTSLGRQCPTGQECVKDGASNPNYGLVSFDNIGVGFLTMFQAITLSDWVFVMYWYMQTSSGWAWLYWCSLVLLVSFFAINLVLAVVDDTFSRSAQEDRDENPEDSMMDVFEQLRDSQSPGGAVAAWGENEKEKEKEKDAVADSSAAVLDPPELTDAAPVQAVEDKGKDEEDEKGQGTGRVPKSSSVAALDPKARKVQQKVLDSMVENLFARHKHESNVPKPNLDINELEVLVAPVVKTAKTTWRDKMEYLEGKPKFFRTVFHVVENQWFGLFIIAVILVNTLFLSMEHHNMSKDFQDALDTGNLTCTIIFMVEMALKLVGLGVKGYARDPWNAFDGFIVLVSIIELAVLSGGALSVLRTFRLLRILKLAKSVRSLRILLGTVMASVTHVLYMTLLLFLFLFMFSVLGMQLFSGKYDSLPEDERPRSRYDTFYWSFITNFQILTGDDWNALMGIGVSVTSEAAILFYVMEVILGAFIVINLFIAILLENFDDQDDSKFELEDLEDRAMELVMQGERSHKCLEVLAHLLANNRVRRYDDLLKKEKELAERSKPPVRAGRSMTIFPPESRIRVLCWDVMHSATFTWFIILAILLNCVFLAMENPSIEDGSSLDVLLEVSDVVFMAIFTVEMLIKWVALGVYRGRGAYFTDSWNVLDAFVVLVSIITLAVPSFAAVRSFRALRPMRVVVRSDQIRVVVSSLYRALPAITNVFFFCMLFWLIFGILGVNLFAGKLFRCNDESIRFQTQCTGLYNVTVDGTTTATERKWENPPVHFDNTYEAILALFQVATLSGWAEIMYNAVDSTTVGEGPRTNNHPEAALFFVFFVIICGFFTLNLFIGVVIDNFNRLKAEYEGSAFLTDEQRQWVATQKLIKSVTLRTKPDVPSNPVRLFCFKIVMPASALEDDADMGSQSKLKMVNHAFGRGAGGGVGSVKSPNSAVSRSASPTALSRQATLLSSGPPSRQLTIQSVPVTQRQVSTGSTGTVGLQSPEAWSRQNTNRSSASELDAGHEQVDAPEQYERHYFEEFIMAMIIINTIVMMTEHHGQSEDFELGLKILNITFVVIFAVEAVLKIAALTFEIYWAEAWNKFDFIIVVVSIVGQFLNTGVGANVVRVLRIGRIFRLIRRAKSLRDMFETLLISIPSLWNIGLFLFVVFFIYAVLGVNFFGKVALSEGGLTDDANFKNFGNSMLVLFRMATGDAWEEMMYGTTIQEPDCSEAAGTCGHSAAPFYFVTFMVLGSFVMLNLFIAVILENFSEAQKKQGVDGIIVRRIKRWQKAWEYYDKRATKKLPVRFFTSMMSRAPVPFGFGGRLTARETLHVLQKLKIPIELELPRVNTRSTKGKSRRGVWVARFDASLKAIAAHASQMDETDIKKTEEDSMSCSCWCFDFDDDRTSTMDAWYAVHCIENRWIQSSMYARKQPERYSEFASARKRKRERAFKKRSRRHIKKMGLGISVPKNKTGADSDFVNTPVSQLSASDIPPSAQDDFGAPQPASARVRPLARRVSAGQEAKRKAVLEEKEQEEEKKSHTAAGQQGLPTKALSGRARPARLAPLPGSVASKAPVIGQGRSAFAAVSGPAEPALAPHKPAAEAKATPSSSAEAGVCGLDGCNKRVWVDGQGKASAACSRTHLKLYRQQQDSRSRQQQPPHEVWFYNREEPFYEFTNFFPLKPPMRLDGQEWSTSEHYYQAMKFKDEATRERIRQFKSPREVFDYAQAHAAERRPDWFKVNRSVMEVAVLQKFRTNSHCRQLLLSTGDKRLVEHTKNDNYWGDGGDGSGKNLLGTLLMKVRDILRREEEEEEDEEEKAPVRLSTQEQPVDTESEDEEALPGGVPDASATSVGPAQSMAPPPTAALAAPGPGLSPSRRKLPPLRALGGRSPKTLPPLGKLPALGAVTGQPNASPNAKL